MTAGPALEPPPSLVGRETIDSELVFCIEQTLGHRTHGQNLELAVVESGMEAEFIGIAPPARARVRVPWALRGSLSAFSALADYRDQPVFFHTQTVSLLAPVRPGRGRYVVSVDATPMQMDELGRWYGHRRGNRFVEAVKRRWYQQVFSRAARVVAWSEWAARSLVADYGVAVERITVVHPGAPPELFAIDRGVRLPRPVRILFVGGDLERKGGGHLLRCFEALGPDTELVMVTDAPPRPAPRVRFVPGVRPGTAAFVECFEQADIFCLPTLGDCTPVAVEEAMAAGLPVVTTTVGANPETVGNGECGLLVPPGEDVPLLSALRLLVEDPELRHRLGRQARQRARETFDARENARRIVRLLEEL